LFALAGAAAADHAPDLSSAGKSAHATKSPRKGAGLYRPGGREEDEKGPFQAVRNRAGLFDAPPGRCELDDVKRLCGVALGAFHGNDRGKGILGHDMLAATDKDRTGQALAARRQ